MIKEAYCSKEVSILLKEKGFEGDISAYYHIWDNGNKVCSAQEFNHSEASHLYISAPTHQMAMRWLREVHNILIVVSITYEKERYDWYICGIKGDPWEKELFHEEKDVTYDTYEEAVEAALKYALKNLI